jgi:hypothetical protein
MTCSTIGQVLYHRATKSRWCSRSWVQHTPSTDIHEFLPRMKSMLNLLLQTYPSHFIRLLRLPTMDSLCHPIPIHICPFEEGWNFIGRPDYLFISPRQRRITGVIDAKKPWRITPQQIAAVLDGICTLWAKMLN